MLVLSLSSPANAYMSSLLRGSGYNPLSYNSGVYSVIPDTDGVGCTLWSVPAVYGLCSRNIIYVIALISSNPFPVVSTDKSGNTVLSVTVTNSNYML